MEQEKLVILLSAASGIIPLVEAANRLKVRERTLPLVMAIVMIIAMQAALQIVFPANYTRLQIISNQVCALVVPLLVIWLFRKWGLFGNQSWIFYCIICLLPFNTLMENIFVTHIDGFRPIKENWIVLFITSAFFLRKQVYTSRKDLLRNFSFLFTAGLLFYAAYSVLFNMFGLEFPVLLHFQSAIKWFSCILFFSINLIFLKSILCIPMRRPII